MTLTKKAETPLAKKRSAPGSEENGDQARIGSKRKRDIGEAEHKAKKKKTDTGGAVVEETPLLNGKVVGAKDKAACRKVPVPLGKTQSRATEVPGASKVAEKSHLPAESSSSTSNSSSSSSSESEAEIPSAKTGKGLSSNLDQALAKTASKNASSPSKTTCSKVPQPTADSSSIDSNSSSDSSDSMESRKTKQPVVGKAALSNAGRVRPTAGCSSESSSDEDSSSDDDTKVVTKKTPQAAAKALPSTSASVKKKPVVDSSDDSSSNSDDSSSDDDTAAAIKTREEAPAAASRPSVAVIPTKEPGVVRPEQTASGNPPLQTGFIAAKALPSTSASVKKKPVVDSSDDSSSSNSSDDSSSDDDTAGVRKTSEKPPAAASPPSVPVIPTKEPVVVRPEQTVNEKPKRKRKRKNKNKNKLPPVQSQPLPAPPALRTAAEFPPAGAGKRKVFNDEEEEESSSEEEDESSEEQAEGGGSDFTADEIRSLYSLSKPAAAVAPVSSIGPQLPKVCHLLSLKYIN